MERFYLSLLVYLSSVGNSKTFNMIISAKWSFPYCLTNSCLEISWTSVVRIYDTSENNFRIDHKLEKCFKESCIFSFWSTSFHEVFFEYCICKRDFIEFVRQLCSYIYRYEWNEQYHPTFLFHPDISKIWTVLNSTKSIDHWLIDLYTL